MVLKHDFQSGAGAHREGGGGGGTTLRGVFAACPDDDESLSKEWRRYHDSFDEQARIVYPSLFAAFNLVYWLYYMYFVVSRY